MKSRFKELLGNALAVSNASAPDASFETELGSTAEETERCGILVRVSPELRRQLKRVAIERRTTVQKLLLQAITVVLEEPTTSFKP
ncbi:ribbon-helix-helix domain-containing protein [Nitrobacter sp. JJSN]|jgi:hypothetical protein|uniref:ribbon-helix-helix domain-containing protein n=1 Tax=Nitrobacter sp. JJSN TaxID=3453033 RepID=UPI003F768764